MTRNRVAESAWLIERSAGPHWWTAGAWSADSLQAVRFCRREDALRVMERCGITNAVVTEHVWRAAAEPEAKATPVCGTCHDVTILSGVACSKHGCDCSCHKGGAP